MEKPSNHGACLALLLAAIALPATASPPPMVMLAMSRDESYFYAAWPDHADLNGDGIADPSYIDSVDYDGYFHPRLCYRYADAAARFEPAGWSDASANRHYCTGALADTFSGNFLNWATMTRLDLVRRALYGGRRIVDTALATVLERAHLPTDGHSFAKTYNGDDLVALTPFEVRADLITDNDGGDGDGFQDGLEGVTLCNTSYAPSGNSQTSTASPLLRFVVGNRALWDANERWQCTWTFERGVNTNANIPISTGIDSIGNDPPDSLILRTPSGNRDHRVRVLACDPAWFDSADNAEHCRLYPDGNRKPAGILQVHGETGDVHFGLVTGSWNRNLSGGALRKAAGVMTDEIDVDGDGSFEPPPASGGIIHTLDLLRVWGYGYGTSNSGDGSGTYFGGTSGDNCGFQLATIIQGDCNAWGNPISEIYLEAVRWFAVNAGRAPTPAFEPNDILYFDAMSDAPWSPDPLAGLADIPSLHVLVLNAGVPSFDHDATSAAILGAETPQSLTDRVGDGESLTGGSYLVGHTSSANDQLCTAKDLDALGSTFGLCPFGPTLQGSYHVAGLAHHARVSDLRSDITGKQSVSTYAIELPPDDAVITVPVGAAGATLQVKLQPAFRLLNTNGIGAQVAVRIVRPHTEVDPGDRAKPGLPNTTPDPTSANGACTGVSGTGDDIVNGVPTSVILTSSTLCRSSPSGSTGQLATTIPVAKSGTGLFHGKFHVVWDDSAWGGDFDADVWGSVDYVVDTNASPPTITVTTTTLGESTANPQLFGFVIEGTTQDGFHAYSGVEGANFVDASGAPGCASCQALSALTGQRGPRSHTFTVAMESNAPELESPLHYAAKWGGFIDANANDAPDLTTEWDLMNGDGVPDHYFGLSDRVDVRGALAAALAQITGSGLPDFDGDGVPDFTDADDDNDGLPDAWEIEFGLQPFDAGDAGLDLDGDHRSNLEEFAAGTNPRIDENSTPTNGFSFEDAQARGVVPAGGSQQGAAVTPSGIIGGTYLDQGLLIEDAALLPGDPGHAADGQYMIAGVSSAGTVDYTQPVRFSFFVAGVGGTPTAASYNAFSVTTDRIGGSGNALRLQAYGVDGQLVGETTVVEGTGRDRIEITTELAFHAVVITPLLANPSNGGIGLDLVWFRNLEPPEPAVEKQVPMLPGPAAALGGLGLALVALRMLRRH